MLFSFTLSIIGCETKSRMFVEAWRSLVKSLSKKKKRVILNGAKFSLSSISDKIKNRKTDILEFAILLIINFISIIILIVYFTVRDY